MVTKRKSQQLLERLGIQVNAARQISNDNGNQYAADYSAELYSLIGQKGITTTSVNWKQFQVIKGYLEKNGASEAAADTISLLIIDTARYLDINPTDVLNDMTETTGLNLDKDTLKALSLFTGNQLYSKELSQTNSSSLIWRTLQNN